VFKKLEPRSGRHLLAFLVLYIASSVWLIYVGIPLWLLIVSGLAVLVIWNRYVQKYLRKRS